MLRIKNKAIVNEIYESLHRYNTLDHAFKAFSEKYHRSYSSIKKAFYRRKSDVERSHGNQKLTDIEEKELLIIIISFSNSYISLSKKMIINIVSACFKKKFAIIGQIISLKDIQKN